MITTDMDHKDVYSSPAFHTPSISAMRDICSHLGIDADDTELAQYRDVIANLEKDYGIVDRLAEPTLPVKYPRTPGHRPSQTENPLNAWYWKTEIVGAPCGKLAGKTVAVKDNVCVAGVPMMNGSRILEGYVPEFDASVVTRVLDQGGIIKGKSTCEHFCCGLSSFNSDKGAVLNPYDNTRSAGGSSSGSAVLVSTREVDMAIGGDQGGSIRVPASWCGIVGLKPTFSLVPYSGAVSLATSIDHLGPMARKVQDCALLLEVLAGYDGGLDCRQQQNTDVPHYSQLLTGNLQGLRIGVVEEGFKGQDPDVDSMVKEAANNLKHKGATVEDISVPMHVTAKSIWKVIRGIGAYEQSFCDSGHAIGSGKGFHPTSLCNALARGTRTRMNVASVNVKWNCILGEHMRRSNQGHYFHKASNLARHARDTIDHVLQTYDALIMPTVPCRPPVLPPADISITDNLLECSRYGENTWPYNATGHPAISVNAGFLDGLPVGMMIVGRHFDDATVLNVAYAHEKLQDWK